MQERMHFFIDHVLLRSSNVLSALRIVDLFLSLASLEPFPDHLVELFTTSQSRTGNFGGLFFYEQHRSTFQLLEIVVVVNSESMEMIRSVVVFDTVVVEESLLACWNRWAYN